MNRSSIRGVRHLIGLAMAGAVMFAAQTATATCERAARKHAELHGVPSDTIRDVWTYRERTMENAVQGFRSWILLKSCRGFVVVEFDLQRRPLQIYATRDCRLADKP